MRKIVLAAIVVALAATAYAQGMSSGMPGGKGRHHEQKSDGGKRKDDSKDTKSALDKLPDKKYDPWQNVREAPQPK